MPTATCLHHAPKPTGPHVRVHPDQSGGDDTPPDLGIGKVTTTYTYNADRQLTQVTRPDGQTLTLDYDLTGGRLSTLTAPTGQTDLYLPPDDRAPCHDHRPGRVGLGYTFDGVLLTGTTWTGPVAGSVSRTYDTDFRVATESVNGANPITFQYDPDSLLTQAGSLALRRHPQHGLLTGTTLGSVTDSFTYSTFGEVSTLPGERRRIAAAGVSSTPATPSAGSRRRRRRSAGTPTTVYGYDPAGRLTDVTVDGTLAAHYDYDGNGNRLSVTRPASGTMSGTYDAQDRLTIVRRGHVHLYRERRPPDRDERGRDHDATPTTSSGISSPSRLPTAPPSSTSSTARIGGSARRSTASSPRASCTAASSVPPPNSTGVGQWSPASSTAPGSTSPTTW